jgi:hypothetical protein
MKNVVLNVQFVQGMNKLTISNFEVETTKINEVSGTLINKILNARKNMKKYGMTIKGFSFNRKFDILLSVNGNAPTNLNELFGGFDNVEAKITLQQTEASYLKFAEILHDLVFEQMTGAMNWVYDYKELTTNKQNLQNLIG